MYIKLLVAAGLLSASLAQASEITYNIDLAYSNVSAVGTITTDGTLGTLTDANFVTYNVLLTDGSNNIVATPPTGAIDTHGGVTASATGLFFDFSSVDYFYVEDNRSNSGYMCLQGPNHACDNSSGPNGNISILVPWDTAVIGVPQDMSGVQQFASTGVAATPEPGSLALLGTGVLGFAGLMRRRLL